MKDFSYITHSHPAYIEGLYNDYVQNPDSVDPEFRKFFEGFDFAISSGANGQTVAASAGAEPAATVEAGQLTKEFAVFSLIQAYRKKGHLVAKTNPIRQRKDRDARLDLKYFGLSEADLQQNFAAGQFVGLGTTSLQAIITHLQKCYAGHVGIEYQPCSSRYPLIPAAVFWKS